MTRTTVARNLSMLSLAALFFVPGLASAKEIDQGFFLDLAALESARIEKEVCDETHPEFSQKNAAAFAASPQSKKTGEDFITSATEGEARKKLLAHLPVVRTEIRANYSQMSLQRLKGVCASYASAIGQMPEPKDKKP